MTGNSYYAVTWTFGFLFGFFLHGALIGFGVITW
jgi:hypothetical protein